MAAADQGQFESPDSDSSGKSSQFVHETCLNVEQRMLRFEKLYAVLFAEGASTTTSIQKDAAQPSNLHESSLSFVYEGGDEHATSKLSNALDCLVGLTNSSKIMTTFTGEVSFTLCADLASC